MAVFMKEHEAIAVVFVTYRVYRVQCTYYCIRYTYILVYTVYCIVYSIYYTYTVYAIQGGSFSLLQFYNSKNWRVNQMNIVT